MGKLILGHVPDENGKVLPDGLASGIYPAARAARLDAVQVLRYE